jgi:hypothetical protein
VGCGSNDIDIWYDAPRADYTAMCEQCGAFTYGTDDPGTIDGWFINPPF